MQNKYEIIRELFKEYSLLNYPLASYDEFIQRIMPERCFKLLYAATQKMGYSQADFVAMPQLMYTVWVTEKTGRPVFEVRPDIMEALRDTDIPDFPLEDLKLPFEGIILKIDQDTFHGPAANTGVLYVTQVDSDRFRVVFDINDEDTHFMNLTTDGCHTLKQSIEKSTQATKEIPEHILKQYEESRIYFDYYDSDVFRFVINLVLYITSPDSDVKQDKTKIHALHQKLQATKKKNKREIILKQLRKAKDHKRYIVGANTKLTKEYKASLTDAGKKWALTHRFKVRGHFRKQACGKGYQDHKRIWVSPYWKGPTYAEMLGMNYVVT